MKQIYQADFEKIRELAKDNGFDVCATNDAELIMQQGELMECFGPDWYMNLPQRTTSEYEYLSRIVDAVKKAFSV